MALLTCGYIERETITPQHSYTYTIHPCYWVAILKGYLCHRNCALYNELYSMQKSPYLFSSKTTKHHYSVAPQKRTIQHSHLLRELDRTYTTMGSNHTLRIDM